MFAFGAESAAALAKSLTMEALVLNRSVTVSTSCDAGGESRVVHTIPSHSWLPGNAGGDQYNLSSI